MAFFRQYIAPLLIVLVFLVSLVAVGARSFLSGDMAAPAPIEEVGSTTPDGSEAVATVTDTIADLPPTLSTLIKGLPDDDLALSEQL
ncbi:MAG: hypothetical protein KME16_08060 [Scytolyngbya sp. HA4215-MV1]|jgi:hypothetical protein|nr:hypothetical protein [Scytolyngbya sp. HA4215-MV1]